MLERLLNSLLGDHTVRNSAHEVLGITVLIENTRPDIEARDIIARLETWTGDLPVAPTDVLRVAAPISTGSAPAWWS